jgi:probable phosphoglycerate mutase
MVELYLIRHAEAMGNVNEVFQGSIDEKLSPKGYRQLEELKGRCKEIALDRLYTSPLSRAVETAQAVNYYHNLDLIKVPELVEIFGGDFEGKPWADLPTLYPEQYHNWRHNQKDFAPPNGETMQQVYDRMVKAMGGILEENLRLKRHMTIAVVSHGCAIRNYQCYLNRADISYMPKLKWADNTAVTKVTFNSLDDWCIDYLNDSSHLSEENSTLKFSNWCKGEV